MYLLMGEGAIDDNMYCLGFALFNFPFLVYIEISDESGGVSWFDHSFNK